MKKWVSVVAALTVAVVLLAGCVPQSRANSQSVVPATPPAQSVVAASSEEQTTGSNSAGPGAINVPTELSFGETIITDSWELTFKSADFSNQKDGEVRFNVYMSIKNLQKESAEPFPMMGGKINLTLDYDDGYTYTGYAYDEGQTFGINIFIKPLETNENIRYSFTCPQEVEDNEAVPLVLHITVEGVKYQIVVR